ncbi:T9SS-dependent choice-of-anchor J family protein [Flavobacterium johnsoniae]|uniref:Endonuclease/exonuclease/phosphatase n=1 Tax=Flavobacterium johnsoniae (strain ATCC 17061 / DSM 2064 / JCM 8514 / BCRC 14874 / CCUG 350202 / NBRC 14942 / NCIMB 11054 / UW101) TaxID=376686 RepID=A5FNW0_FLAJ1|nr:choice-of-anchor J domain-containing protein [Flavobacterium johnsoniae]ABQ03112.1 Endonuclease/exonuclease/phosphatase [Flavobacterium johnsoniae UW101]OXG01453.1 endonuclease [Flavobacterium johnsoniae UW101]WQG80026.1 choice-of-anchor J domain-containing protein [Flavobacterium johnsoniae UW101]SHL84895.1 Por secretion system C-terminal sorting domain-containing protein [Flavobacterium johnsoniae]
MKNNYSFRHLMTFLGFFYCFTLSAQTMPAAQTLPVEQNFESWLAADAQFPAGFQGWTLGGNDSGVTQYLTSPTFTDYNTILTGKGANTNSGGFYNYVGKLGFLNTGSVNLNIGFAFSSVGTTNVQVQYDVMTIRNPSDASNTRVNEVILQYRVGTTGDFISLLGTAYRNNSITQTGTNVYLPQNSQLRKITLPAECDNQPVVQIRWASRQVSGGGGRPSFAIDNLDIRKDTFAPANVSGYPKTANVLGESFDFINKIDEVGKTYYVLLPGGSAEPTVAQIKAGQDSNGTAALQAGIFDITNPALEYIKSFTGLPLSTAYSIFSISEDIPGNIQASVNKIDVTTLSVMPPAISTSVSVLNLGGTEPNFDALTKSYQIGASDLTANVVLTASGSFTISKDNVTFTSSLTFVPADFDSNATPTIYVKFTPASVGSFTGSITHETTGAVTKTVSVTGIGINPYVQGFNDANVLTNSGWTQYNVSGPTNKWVYTNTARNVNSGTGAVLMNGYSDSGASQDWLISPKLRLNTFGDFPLLSFYSRKFYAGPGLKLKVSTDYDGVSNPNTATWTDIDGKFPTSTGNYVQSQYIKLNAYKTDHTYLAWVYETTAGGTNNASEWSFDDYAVTDEAGYVDSNPVLDFGVVDQNTVSASQSFNFKAEGYGDITITAPASYQISADNISFGTTVVVSAADAFAGKILYAKFAPTTKELKISGTLTVTGTSLNKQIGSLTGSSLPKSDTFDVVTYNMEFFGAPTSAYGPADKALQMQNAVKVINKLDADVYVVQEISSDAAIDDLITQMNVNGKSFNKVVSTSWSYSWETNPSDPNYPPQKLVVIYDTKTTTLKNTRVMFKEFYDELRAGTKSLTNYPGTNSNFFSSGRLPYMVTLETNLNGVKNEIKFVDLHARANSGTDISRYNMRKYDVEVLKDSLDTHYGDSNIILLGDYNDDVKASVIAGQPSSYQSFVTDTNNYKALTLEISQAGAYSFLSSGGFLDHITISNELFDQYINESIAVYDPRNDIANYTTTTSDHGPVIARFNLKQDVLSTPDFGTKNGFYVKAYPNPTSDVINFTVKTNESKNLKLRLYDLNGRALGNPIDIQSSEEVNTTVMSLRNLNAGLYIYTLSENNKVVYKNKILKN